LGFEALALRSLGAFAAAGLIDREEALASLMRLTHGASNFGLKFASATPAPNAITAAPLRRPGAI
jgi:hypothetical protein